MFINNKQFGFEHRSLVMGFNIFVEFVVSPKISKGHFQSSFFTLFMFYYFLLGFRKFLKPERISSVKLAEQLGPKSK